MKTLLLGAAIAVCALGRAYADPAEDALRAKAETCVRTAAPQVVPRADDLTDATNTLYRLCGVEITRVEDYDANAHTLADWQGRSSPAQLNGVVLDPLTGDLKTPPGFKMEWDSASASISELKRVTPDTELMAMIAQIVLEVRKPVKTQ